MKHLTTILFLLVFTGNICSQYSDPNIPKPTSGYGSDGSHTVGVISFANPEFPSKDIEIYYPSDVVGKVPTLFYSHAYGGNISGNIIGMLDYVARKGYAIVFVPYATKGVTVDERYDNLLKGFRMAARNYPGIIDTTRVGFMGHSFGGGASFGLAYRCFTDNNWGSNGRFIYALAQWYSYNLDPVALKSFPADTKVLVEVFDDDTTNDHRMAVDIFRNINIDPAEKDYLLVRSDTIGGYVYAAVHSLPNTSVAFDALDYYAYYRLIDALCDYTFNKNAEAKKTALGNGSAEQTTMPGGLKPLMESDDPQVVYSESKYTFPCSDTMNPRLSYCPEVTATLQISNPDKSLKIIPERSMKRVKIVFPENDNTCNLSVYNAVGKQIVSMKNEGSPTVYINVSDIPAGVYIVVAGNRSGRFILF